MAYFVFRGGSQRLFLGAVIAIAAAAIAGCSGLPPAAPASQSTTGLPPASRVRGATLSWTFKTLDNPDSPDFNELLGINNLGKICGFDGVFGDASDPAEGYCIASYGNSKYRRIRYPGAADTVATSTNSARAIAGYYTPTQGGIYGFIYNHGFWSSYRDPELRKGTSNITELLGVNQSGLAVGFYQDEYGVDHGFELNEVNSRFHPVKPPGGVSVEATGINGKGDIVGFMTTASGSTVGFLLKGATYTIFAYPKASLTEALAVNWQDQIVGLYRDGSGTTHGFVYVNPLFSQQWISIDEPKADGVTVLTSIQDHDYMVGYYVDSAGNTNGFLATPQ